jgi:ABC-type long-subunit fatty acid transport system fused permease/ATPase subunit
MKYNLEINFNLVLQSIAIILPLEGLNTLTLNGNEGPSNGLQLQEQRTEAAQTYTVRVVHESEANAQNAETSRLDSNTMQIKKFLEMCFNLFILISNN